MRSALESLAFEVARRSVAKWAAGIADTFTAAL
jgi:hypothetical protein